MGNSSQWIAQQSAGLEAMRKSHDLLLACGAEWDRMDGYTIPPDFDFAKYNAECAPFCRIEPPQKS